MNNESKYKELQEQYGATLSSLTWGGNAEDAVRLKEHLSEIQRELTEFCLANGIDLKSLERDLTGIEWGVVVSGTFG